MVEHGQELAQRSTAPGADLVGLDEAARGPNEAPARAPRQPVQRPHRRIADASPGRVDDPLEGEVVVRLADQPDIGDGVPDLLALVEAGAADHTIRQSHLDEALLERPRLEGGPHEDGRRGEPAAAPLPGFDFVTDPARLLLIVPEPGDAQALAEVVLGPERLAVPCSIAGDEP